MLVPALGGSERKLTEFTAGSVSGWEGLMAVSTVLGWSPDGKWLAFADREDGDADQTPSREKPETDTSARIGKRIMVRSDERFRLPVSRQFRHLVEPRIDRLARRPIALPVISPSLAKQTELR